MSRGRVFAALLIMAAAVVSYWLGSHTGMSETRTDSPHHPLDTRPTVSSPPETAGFSDSGSRGATRGPLYPERAETGERQKFFQGTRYAGTHVSTDDSILAENALEEFKNMLRQDYTAADFPGLEHAAQTGDAEAAYILYVLYMECTNSLLNPVSPTAAARLKTDSEIPAKMIDRYERLCSATDSYTAMSEAMRWLLVSADRYYEPAMLRLVTMGFYPAFRLASRGEYDAIPRYRDSTFRTLAVLRKAGRPIAFEITGTFIANGTFGPPDLEAAYIYLRAHDLMASAPSDTGLSYLDLLSRQLDAEELLRADNMARDMCREFSSGVCQ